MHTHYEVNFSTEVDGLDEATAPETVRLRDGETHQTDTIQVYDAANSSALPLGTVNLGRSDYTTSNLTFGASGTASTMLRSGSAITITLGTPSAPAATAAGSGTMSWTPSATATDRAGNGSSPVFRLESGTADIDF